MTPADHHTLGDLIAVETDQIAIYDPVLGVSISGFLFGVGVIVEKSGVWGEEFGVWIRGLVDLYAAGSSAQARWKSALLLVVSGMPR